MLNAESVIVYCILSQSVVQKIFGRSTVSDFAPKSLCKYMLVGPMTLDLGVQDGRFNCSSTASRIPTVRSSHPYYSPLLHSDAPSFFLRNRTVRRSRVRTTGPVVLVQILVSCREPRTSLPLYSRY